MCEAIKPSLGDRSEGFMNRNDWLKKSAPLRCHSWAAEPEVKAAPFGATWLLRMSQEADVWQLDSWHWGQSFLQPSRSSWAQRGFATDPNSTVNSGSDLFRTDTVSFLEVFLAQLISGSTFIISLVLLTANIYFYHPLKCDLTKHSGEICGNKKQLSIKNNDRRNVVSSEQI